MLVKGSCDSFWEPPLNKCHWKHFSFFSHFFFLSDWNEAMMVEARAGVAVWIMRWLWEESPYMGSAGQRSLGSDTVGHPVSQKLPSCGLCLWQKQTSVFLISAILWVFVVVVICSCPLSLALTHDEMFHQCYSHPTEKLRAIMLFNCLLKPRSSNLELTLDSGHTPVYH